MIKKLKDFYSRNRVYSILMLISIMCILAILVGVIVYFLGQTSKDKYGNRLNGIGSYKISEKKQKEIKSKSEENELVKNTTVNIRGRLVYITIELSGGKHSDAESIAQSLLEIFSEEEKNFYDIQFIIDNENSEEENFPIMGYIRKGGSVIKWTNYVQ